MGHAHHEAIGALDLDGVFRGPSFPRSIGRVAGLECETPVLSHDRPDGGERSPQLIVFDEHLEGMTGHHDKVELVVPIGRGEVTENPLDVRAPAGLVEHRLGRVEPAQPPGMPGLPRPVQQRTGPAADVEYCLG